MDRRTILKQIGGVSVAATLAGCSVQEQDGSDGGDGSSGGSGGSDGGDGSSGGSDGGSQGGTATAWYALPDNQLNDREAIIEAFNEQSEHTVEGSDIAELGDQTTNAIPAGQGPDVFNWAHDWVGDYYQRGFVVDQSDQLNVDLSRFSQAARNAIQFDGAVVGLPYSAETVTLMVNTDKVDSTPETFDEMLAVMEEHHDPDNGQYGLSLPMSDPYFMSGWLQAFGGYYFDPEADPALGVNMDETVQGLEFALQNLRPYVANDPGYEPQAATFAEGNAALAINGPWYRTTLDDNGVNYEVTTFPELDGGEVSPYTGITMWYFSKAMGDGGPSAAAGREFAEYFVTNEDHLLSLAESQGAIPVLDSLVGSDDLPSYVQSFSESVDQGVPMPTDPRMNQVWGPVESALANAFNGDASAQDALDTAAEEIRSNWE